MQNSFLNPASTNCFLVSNYFATVALSIESTETESTVSTATVSESLADTVDLVELPQEAKLIATIAANTTKIFFNCCYIC